jgi:hypothetical protein
LTPPSSTWLPWTERRRTASAILAAVGYTGLIAVSAFQTFSGRAPFDLDRPTGAVLGVSAILLVVVGRAALLGLRQAVQQGHAREATT